MRPKDTTANLYIELSEASQINNTSTNANGTYSREYISPIAQLLNSHYFPSWLTNLSQADLQKSWRFVWASQDPAQQILTSSPDQFNTLIPYIDDDFAFIYLP